MDKFLLDQRFLDELDNLKIKDQFVRLTILSWEEEPIGEIQGKVTSGSININGSSSLRRTANLTLFAEEKENDLSRIDQELSINKKVKMEIGIRNTVPPYIFSDIDDTTNRMVIKTMNYQDLYGDIIWFPLGIYIIFDPNISHGTTGVSISVSLKDKMCLLNGDAGGRLPACTEFHKREQEDENGLVTIDYPVIRQIIQESVHHWGQEDPARIIIDDVDEQIKQVMRWMGTNPLYYWEEFTLSEATNELIRVGKYALTPPEQEDIPFQIYEYGDEVGFILTDFIYPGELIGDAGSTVTDVLDKIISVLGNFEYFYDVYGNFHFQEIKNYLNITYTTQLMKDYSVSELTNNNQLIDYDLDLVGGKAAYIFAGSKLITSFSNAPKYSNIKNDMVVWGVKKSADGNTEIPIRFHLAIDKKPELQYGNKLGTDGSSIQDGEYYYQDHYNVEWYEDEFGVKRAKVALTTPDADTQGGEVFRTYDWREELYMQGIAASSTGSDYSYYFTELVWEWPKIWDFDTHDFKQNIKENPAQVDYFLDIIDPSSDIGQYNVRNIGRRGVVVSEDKINCVFEQIVPDYILINNNLSNEEQQAIRDECDRIGQNYNQISEELFNLLSMGGIQNSCYQRICEMLYQYTNMNNTITIQAIPIYYLEPNTRINVQDLASGIIGDFMIQSISLPLTIDGTMSITASKALQKI